MADVVNLWESWMARRPFTPRELAELFSLSVRSIERWCQIGELPAVKVGAQWRIPYGGLEEYLTERWPEIGPQLEAWRRARTPSIPAAR